MIYKAPKSSSVFSSSWSSMLQAVINKDSVMCSRRICCSHYTSHQSYSQLFVQNRDFFLHHMHSTPSLRSPPEYREDNITHRHNSRMWRTDRQTLHPCNSNSNKGQGRTLQPRRPRPLSGSKGHPQKDSYYLGTKVLWESMWFQDESHKILYQVSFRRV